MGVVIVNSGGYNTNSIVYALNRVGVEAIVSENVAVISGAERVILPGVGHAKAAMQKLSQLGLIDCVKNLKQPVMGICLGMQIMFGHSEEGDADCLAVIDGRVKKIPPSNVVPQMGWNKICGGVYSDEFVYFANSYYLPFSEMYATSYVQYGDIKICATVQKDNFFGCQFHPEKSGKAGEKILIDFVNG